jgi:NADPH2:quinone reductase
VKEEETMKAIRVHSFGPPDVLKLEDAPGLAPAPGQVLVGVKAVGINPVETYIRAGNYGPMKFPFTPGNDCAGIVEAVASDVKHFKKGDRVYTDKTISGSYAELAVADANYVHPLPDRVTFQQGAGVGTAGGTAYRGLFQRGRGKPDEAVLIHGATGGVGTSAVQLARAAGMFVVATSSSDRGHKFALEQGAHHATDHDIVQRLDEVQSLTDGKGFDLIIETSAHKNLGADLPALAKGGRVVVIGSRGKVEIDPRDTMSREADILGLMLFGASATEHREMYSALTAGMENGTFRPVVGLELRLADAAKAHTLVIEGDQFGKIVLIP